jgi:hypothetical protein
VLLPAAAGGRREDAPGVFSGLRSEGAGEKMSFGLPCNPSFDVAAWYGGLAPAATPKAIVDKLSTEIARILAMPDIKGKIAVQGMATFISTPEQFAAIIKADSAKYAKIIKEANIKTDQQYFLASGASTSDSCRRRQEQQTRVPEIERLVD